MKQQQKKVVTQEEVSQALQRFVQKGGIIRRLPDDKTRSGRAVGTKYNNSELGNDSHGG